MGIFKGETRIRHHLQAVFNKTASKLKVRCFMDRLKYELIRQGKKNGPVVCDEEGNLTKALHYQEDFVHF